MNGIRIGLLSDTHGFCNEDILRYLETCDEIWHAGDIGENEVLEKLTGHKPLRIVFGNIDTVIMQKTLPEDLFFELEGFRILITHIAGNPPAYNKRVKGLIREHKPNILVCGHSHILKIGWDKENTLWYMNPGAAGKHGFHAMRTMLRFTLVQGKIENAEVIELGKRGAL
jgi:uncharacterized protein